VTITSKLVFQSDALGILNENNSIMNMKSDNEKKKGIPGFNTPSYQRASKIQKQDLKKAKNMDEVMLAHRKFEENLKKFRNEDNPTTYKDDMMLFWELNKEHTEFWNNYPDPTKIINTSNYNNLLFGWIRTTHLINKAERILDHNEWDLKYLLTPLYALKKKYLTIVKKEGFTFEGDFLVKNKSMNTKPKGSSKRTIDRYKKVKLAFDRYDGSGKTKRQKCESLAAKKFDGKYFTYLTILDIIDKKKYLITPVEKPTVKR
jgi:hypothetical protein